MRKEYSCRRIEPSYFDEEGVRTGKFFSMYRTSRKYKKPYRVIIGRLKSSGKYADEAYRYKKEDWQFKQAKSHCREHDGIKFEEQYFNDVTGNPFQTPADKLGEFLRLKRSGYLGSVADLKLTLANIGLFTVALEEKLKEFIKKNSIDGTFNFEIKQENGFKIEILYSLALGLNNNVLTLYFDAPPYMSFLKIFTPNPNGDPIYLRIEESPTSFHRLWAYEVGNMVQDIIDSPVPDEWYLGVDL